MRERAACSTNRLPTAAEQVTIVLMISVVAFSFSRLPRHRLLGMNFKGIPYAD